MAYQTNYNEAPEAGLPGEVVSGEEFNAISRICEVVAGMGFGVPAGRGADKANGAIEFAAAGSFLGLTRLDRAGPAANGDKYAKGGNMAIVTEGPVWGRAGEAVVAGDQAYWDSANQRWTADDANDLEVPGVMYDTSADAEGVVVLAVRNR